MNKRRNILFAMLLVAGSLILTGSSFAQQYADTFNVTVADKTPEHPHYGEGHHEGLVVNGEQSPTLYLVRGELYLLLTNDMPNHLSIDFYTRAIGGGSGFYDEIVKSYVVSQGRRELLATNETPDTLYYASPGEPWTGGTILIVDSLPTSSVEEVGEHWALNGLAGVQVAPNPFSQHTRITYQLEERSEVCLEVVDVTGRVVAQQNVGIVESGEHWVEMHGSGLAAGMYYYRLRAINEGVESVSSGMMQVIR